MLKPVFASVAALVIASPVLAQEENKQFYVGFNYGIGSGEETISIADEEEDYDTDVTSTRLSLGIIADDRIRFEASYGGYDLEFDDFEDSEITTLEIDGILTFQRNDFTPYLMAGFGVATYQDTGDFFEDGDDLSGFSIQLGAGLIFQPHEIVELDASYRLKIISWETVEVFGEDIESSNSMGLLNFGARILF